MFLQVHKFSFETRIAIRRKLRSRLNWPQLARPQERPKDRVIKLNDAIAMSIGWFASRFNIAG